MTTAVYAGSFDPITLGHLHIIDKAYRLFDEFYVIVANNPNKKYMFTLDERRDLCERSVYDYLLRTRVEVVTTDGYVMQKAKELHADVMVRGLRAFTDFQPEFDVYQVNKKIQPGVETIFIMPDLDLSTLRSSLVKGLVGPPGWVDVVEPMVHRVVLNALCGKYVEDMTKERRPRYLESMKVHYKTKAYHNWVHVVRCIEELRRWEKTLTSYQFIYMLEALVYHDYPLENTLEWHIDAAIRNMVKATYHDLPTADRANATQTREQKLIHDIDLSVLAWTPSKYDEYVKLVRTEYDISDDKWTRGRVKFLRSMLSRKRVFLTEEYEGSEDDARRNMCEELKSLGRNR